MSVIGIDFGNENCLIAITRRGGVDVVLNESSQRQTPSVVSFTDKMRHIGESGAGNAILNWKNTITQVKRLLGAKYEDVKDELKYLGYQVKPDANGYCLIEVNYLNKKVEFTPQQVVAMLLLNLRESAEKETGTKITDCVIAVPPQFTDFQRRAMLNAADIAGLRCLKLVNDSTAAAIDYGFFKTDFSETQPLNVAFVDVGHAATTISIVSFTKSQVKMVSTANENNFGSRDYDHLLADYFTHEIKKKYSIDVTTNMKAKLRLLQACEKLKKVLSANPVSIFNIENLMDVDISFTFERSKLEELAQPLLDRLEVPVKKAIANSGLGLDEIHVVEIIGGGSRIPSIKAKLSAIFGKPLSTTLNATETVVKGASLQAAMLSPAFRVRELSIVDTLAYSINLGWKSTEENAGPTNAYGINKHTPVFKAGDGFPSTKMLTFNRGESFDVIALYGDQEAHTPNTDLVIARCTVTIPADKAGEPSKIKIRVKENAHSVLYIEGAQLFEEIEEKPAADAMETDNAAPSDAADKDVKMEDAQKPAKKKVVKTELPVKVVYNEFTSEQLAAAIRKEQEMQQQDKLVIDTAEKKNTLESYIYECRDRVSEYGDYHEYISDADRTAFLELLNNTQNWLYEDGDDAEKQAYEAKIAELRVFGDPVANRYAEANKRPQAAQSLRDSIANFVSKASSTDEKYAHIEQAEKEKVLTKCAEIGSWLENETAKANATPKHKDVQLTAALISSKQRELENICNPIMNKPKPKPKPQPQPQPQAQPEQPAAGAEQQQEQQPQPEAAQNQEQQQDTEMPKAKVDDLD